VGDMKIMHPKLLDEIEAFLSETGMGESYFGKRATGNSELVFRLRDGKRVWPETAAKVRCFIKRRRVAAGFDAPLSGAGLLNSTTHNTPSGSRQHSQKLGAAE
jgi:hypothetical protein